MKEKVAWDIKGWTSGHGKVNIRKRWSKELQGFKTPYCTQRPESWNWVSSCFIIFCSIIPSTKGGMSFWDSHTLPRRERVESDNKTFHGLEIGKEMEADRDKHVQFSYPTFSIQIGGKYDLSRKDRDRVITNFNLTDYFVMVRHFNSMTAWSKISRFQVYFLYAFN